LIEELPWLNKLGPFARSAAFLSIHRYIICFDDIERRGRGLEPKEVFGLISLLTEQRQCRVIAILNSDALAGPDRHEYESFREKVFDFEIKYAPSPVECASLVFGDKDCNRLLAGEYSQRLGITSIRILQRIWRTMETLVPKVQGYESELTRQVIHSLVLLTWCYNSKESGTPSYQHVKGLGYVDFLSSEDKKEQPKEEVEWNELLKAYGYQNTNDLDSQICFYLENGFLVNEKFLGVVKNMNESVLQAKTQGAFSDIWDIYHGSFKDNEADLVKAIKDRLLAGAKWLSVREVNGERWPRLIGQNVLFVKWRLAVFCLCGGEPCGQVVNIHSIRRVSVKRLVRPDLVVERQVALQPLLGCADGLVRMQVHFLVFDALPQPLDKHIVAPAPLPVHADGHAVGLEEPSKF